VAIADWKMRIVRLGIHNKGPRPRTYGTYQVFHDDVAVAALSGHVCECIGPGDTVRNSGHRIPQGRYEVWTQFGKYVTIGFRTNPSPPGKQPMPALGLREPGNPNGVGERIGILIHPGHPRNPDRPVAPYLSSIGCINPTKPLGPKDRMDFVESRARVIALIDDLRNFAPDAFEDHSNTPIKRATLVIEGEPTNILNEADEVVVAGGSG
jgi:hypothetical protein